MCHSSGGHLLAHHVTRKQCHLLGRPEVPIPAYPPLHLHLPYVELPLTFQVKNALSPPQISTSWLFEVACMLEDVERAYQSLGV